MSTLSAKRLNKKYLTKNYKKKFDFKPKKSDFKGILERALSALQVDWGDQDKFWISIDNFSRRYNISYKTIYNRYYCAKKNPKKKFVGRIIHGRIHINHEEFLRVFRHRINPLINPLDESSC